MRILFTLCLLLLAGCSSQPAPSAFLDKETSLRLPAPRLEHPFYRQQLLTARVKGRAHELMAVLEADGSKLTLVGLTPTGVRLFRVSYDEQGIATQQLSPLVTGGMPPVTQVLADVMLCYWPLEAWQARLPEGWRLEDEGMVRRLLDPDGRLVSEVFYQRIGGEREPVRLVQHAFDYQLQMQRLAP